MLIKKYSTSDNKYDKNYPKQPEFENVEDFFRHIIIAYSHYAIIVL